jgi:nucleotide-binding universal stress UspA family protein
MERFALTHCIVSNGRELAGVVMLEALTYGYLGGIDGAKSQSQAHAVLPSDPREVDMRRILAATDFSARATPAICRAGLLAEEHSAAVILCHVVDDDQPDTLLALETDEAQRLLAQLRDGLPEPAREQAATSVVKGDPFDGILNAADEAGAELIVIGSHRRRLLRDVFFGTTAERIMRRGSLPVLMVNRPPASGYRRIIVAVDLSDTSSQALTAARDLGLFSGAQVFVLHAFDAMLTTLASASLGEEKMQAYLNDTTRQARQEVQTFLAAIDLQDVSTTVIVREAAPVPALKDAVKDLGADLVVLGTRGRTGGLASLVLGSVAEEAIRELDVDVLAVPPKTE